MGSGTRRLRSVALGGECFGPFNFSIQFKAELSFWTISLGKLLAEYEKANLFDPFPLFVCPYRQ